MTPESENQNFDQLKKLLALKRHEVPPPGYFNNFSRDVISRIRAGETAPTRATVSWLERLTHILSPRPAFAGAFGLATCAILVCGILYSARMDEPSNQQNLANYPTLPMNTSADPNTMLSANAATPLNGATADPLFNPSLQATPVSFRPFGNGDTNSGQ